MLNINILLLVVISIIFIYIKYCLKYSKHNNKLEHMASPDEAIANVASIYNNTNMSVTNLQANSIKLGTKFKLSGVGDAYANDEWLRLMKADDSANYGGNFAATKLYSTADSDLGALNVRGDTGAGNLNLRGGSTIKSDGRMHISGTELLYLLNKNGVIIGKEWGGNGNLQVQGNISVGGNVSASNFKFFKAGANEFEYHIHGNGGHPMIFRPRGQNIVKITSPEGNVIAQTSWAGACRGDRGNSWEGGGAWSWRSCGGDKSF